VQPSHILITAQELPKNLEYLVNLGVLFNACSLHQLETYGKLFPNSNVSIRINPGLGSGHSNKTNDGGPSSSFGIWHEYTNQIKDLLKRYKLNITRLHTHIGSGTDPAIWEQAAILSLQQTENFPSVKILNLGGGFKIARMHDDLETDINAAGQVISKSLKAFAKRTGRQLHLEIEPGHFLTGNAGSLITTVQDIVDTGEEGYTFLKIDSGMTEILRPNLYGSQHPLIVVNELHEEHKKYVVVGHCCESGDLLTPYPNDPDAISTRLLQKAEIGDVLVVEGVGAYCAYMSAQNYNSFPLRPEVMVCADGSIIEICRRETIDEMLALEV